MSASNARELARQAVTRVRERSAYAHETLDSLLADADLSPRDRAFSSRLAFGTVACRGTLDEAVQRFVKEGVRLESVVGDCLATSAYEVLFMRTPARAAVSEGVELVRSVRPAASGLANAVLRRLSGEAASFPWGDPATDIPALARLHGHPEWLTHLLVDELGRDLAETVLSANNEPAPLFLATLPFRIAEDGVVSELEAGGAEPLPCPISSCLIAGDAGSAVSSAALAEGRVVVADAGAQFAVSTVPLHDGAAIVELGAGRGTKSVLLAARGVRAGMSIRVTAVDLHSFKLDAAQQLALKTGAPGIDTLLADGTDPAAAGMPAPGSVDVVLVDAPCTGFGTLRRHPDRRWRSRADEVATLAALGSSLLRAAAVLVKPGGFVVYSTCTITPQENDLVVDGFLASDEGSQFLNDSLSADVPHEWGAFVTPKARFQSLPAPGGPDGHYVARLKRVG